MGSGKYTNPTDSTDQTDHADATRQVNAIDHSPSVDGGAPQREHKLRPSGGYRNLLTFQITTIIYDATVCFCDRFIDHRSRLIDQMVQAARSGRQNIAEGSRASATSSQTELRLVNVARSSLDELLLDYQDYLRQHRLRLWGKDDPEALAVRSAARRNPSNQATDQHGAKHTNPDEQIDRSDPSDPSDMYGPYRQWITHADPTVVANALICLIYQATYLLDKQITTLEKQFIHDGGYSETLAAARYVERDRQRQENTAANEPNPVTSTPPDCPSCGKTMVIRTARSGAHAGSQFWGCMAYPTCKGTRPL